MIQDICYEKIVDHMWFANYFGLKVIMNYNNGYVNITKLCTDGGKQFKEWKELNNSKEMLAFYEERINRTTDDEWPNNFQVLYNDYTGRTDGAYDICRGEYIHPLLIPHVACWMSPEFAYNTSIIIQDFTAKYYKIKYEEMRNALLQADLELSNTQDHIIEEKTAHAGLQQEHCFAEQQHLAACDLINKQ